VVAVEEDKPEALAALQHALPALDPRQQLVVVTVPTKYPAGGERQLIEALTGHEVPSLAKPTDIGYLCQNAGTAAALFRYLESGRPVTSRVITVTGGAVVTPRNLEVRLGTRIGDLVAACGGYKGPVAKLVMGGSMMGLALGSDQAAVGRATNCIIAAAEHELRQSYDAVPCIRCGDCVDVCPAYLMPFEIFFAAKSNDSEALEELGLFDCIECGCCDVVCPSHIPLTESFRVGKRKFVQSMDHDTRVRWLDNREQLRRQRVDRFERKHERSTAEERSPLQRRLEAVADVIVRARRVRPATETTQGTGGTNA
jgi:electron transport complex protein RnfC